jgi:uncharacterized protein (DUF169 family)
MGAESDTTARWLEWGKAMRRLINPATYPVAVRFVTETSEIPPTARRPLRDLKVRMAPCQAAAMVRRYGWTMAFGKEDLGCAIAGHTYGWERLTDEQGAVEFHILMRYADDEQAAREMLRAWPLLQKGEGVFVVYTPLEWAKVEPDVVLFYVNPAQLMRLIHGATQRRGHALESRFSGRAASCTEGILAAYMDNSPKVVVPGNGDRVWAGCQDHEMIMAVPASRLPEVVEGLEKTHQSGVRYPIPTYLRYAPEVAFSLPLSDIFRPEELVRLKKR